MIDTARVPTLCVGINSYPLRPQPPTAAPTSPPCLRGRPKTSTLRRAQPKAVHALVDSQAPAHGPRPTPLLVVPQLSCRLARRAPCCEQQPGAVHTRRCTNTGCSLRSLSFRTKVRFIQHGLSRTVSNRPLGIQSLPRRQLAQLPTKMSYYSSRSRSRNSVHANED